LESGLASGVGVEVVVVTVPVVSVDSVAAGSLCGFCADSVMAGAVALSDSAAGEAFVASGAAVAASLPELDAGSANVPALVNESRRAMAVEAKNRSTRIPDITNSPCEPVQRRTRDLSERLPSIYGGRRGDTDQRLSDITRAVLFCPLTADKHSVELDEFCCLSPGSNGHAIRLTALTI
jgi:hypothetical protein